jgi:rRNA maturation endonuclease Nob1
VIIDTIAEPSALIELRCGGCGYGVSVWAAPERCPMCGGSLWESLTRPGETTGREWAGR